MEYSLLGPTGVKVSKICLGTATFGVAPDAQEAGRVVHAALDLGINFFDTGKPGIYHAADDEPAPVRDFLPELAQALGAKPPRRVPAWLIRLLAGEAAVDMMIAVDLLARWPLVRRIG